MGMDMRERKSGKGRQENERKEAVTTDLVTDSGDASSSRAHLDAKKTPKKSQGKKVTKKSPDQAATRGWLASCCDRAKYVFLLLVVPPFLNYASLQREAVELKPEGELYDVGWGRKMFLSCKGKGTPTVVLDAPTGMSSDVWVLVQKALQEHTNVCIYDRAGLGFSDRPLNQSKAQKDSDSTLNNNAEMYGASFTVESMADDLHRLITSSSQQPRPLVLVGSELGALVMQFYAHLYDQETAGLVLVNPLPEDLFSLPESAWTHHWFGSLAPTFQSLQLGAALGITRLGLLVGALKQPVEGDNVPEEVVLRQKYLLCQPRHLSSVVDEHHFINETFSQIRTLRKLRSLPSNISISVLSGNYYDEQMPSHLNKEWAIGEQKLLSRLPQFAKHVVMNGADRHVLYRKPQLVVEAVLKVVRAWRRKSERKGERAM